METISLYDVRGDFLESVSFEYEDFRLTKFLTTLCPLVRALVDVSRLIKDLNKAFGFGIKTYLLVDDDNNILQLNQKALEHLGHYAVVTDKAELASKLVNFYKPDYVILDYNMPSIKGDALAKKLVSASKYLKVFILTGETDLVGEEPVISIFNKPCTMDTLVPPTRNLSYRKVIKNIIPRSSKSRVA